MLEVIEKGHCTDQHPVPLLFVHGAAHAAWCWEEHFLSYFAGKGYRAVALSFRGHGRSPTTKPLRKCTIKDYTDDVRTVANELPNPPVLIGHSVGGFVVQKYLESSTAPAAVLLASIPPAGAAGFFSRQFRRHPWLVTRAIATGKSLHCINTPKLARESFFCALTPESVVARCAERLQEESAKIPLELTLRNLPKSERVTTPMLVLGGQRDASVIPKELHATAAGYGTNAETFPDMGHDMMLEPGWRAVAERIDGWLAAQGY
jgi:pimeloyl-ACP methyl ester carboxylesterase